MSIIIFLVLLAVLIFVHELGHFLAAKKSGVRVDEFGLGFPPTAVSKKYGETVYSINTIPFGGFVKIFGENPDGESISGPDSGRSFVNKSKLIQIFILAAGVIFNIIFAWLLISFGYMSGLPTSAVSGYDVRDAGLTIVGVQKNSPAEKAGLQIGDRVVSIENHQGKKIENPQPEAVFSFISSEKDQPLKITYERSGKFFSADATPKNGVVEGKPAIGISMDMIGTLKLGPVEAFLEGAKMTTGIFVSTVASIAGFFKNIFVGKSDFSQIAGPVGIVGMVGDASSLGFAYLLSFAALISINLAVINLIPFPALDGGRILFVIIEAIRGKAIKPKVANIANAVGFFLLMALMIVVTYHDVAKLFVK